MEEKKLIKLVRILLRLWRQIQWKLQEEPPRCYLEIYAQILIVAAVKERLKSHIGNTAKLNFKMAESYLEKLKEAGLIDYNLETKLFRTTNEGMQFLESLSKSINLLRRDKIPPMMELSDEAAFQILSSII